MATSTTNRPIAVALPIHAPFFRFPLAASLYPTTTSSSTTGTQSRTVAGAGVEPLFFRSQAPLVSAAVLDWVPVVEEEVVVMAALARLT